MNCIFLERNITHIDFDKLGATIFCNNGGSHYFYNDLNLEKGQTYFKDGAEIKDELSYSNAFIVNASGFKVSLKEFLDL